MLLRFLLLLFLLIAMDCRAGEPGEPFPTTPVLDNFNRVNNTTSLGANWTISTSATWGNDALGIISDTAYDHAVTNGGMGFWNVSSFSGTIEVYMTVSTKSPTTSTEPSVQCDSSLTSYDGYLIYFGATTGTAIDLFRMAGTSETKIATFPLTQIATNGDSMGMSVTPAGLISVYYKSVLGGGWVLLGTFTDTTYTCAYIGMSIDDTTTRLANFGGGTQALSAPLTVLGGLTVKGHLTVK